MVVSLGFTVVSLAETRLVIENGPVVGGGPRGHGGNAHHGLEHGRKLFVGKATESDERVLVIGPSAGLGGGGTGRSVLD